MNETLTEHPHIARYDQILHGEPVIKGTRVPVRAIIETLRLGTTPEEMLSGFPHLKLAQIYDAISYYYDHQAEIEDYIEQNHIPDELIDPVVRNL